MKTLMLEAVVSGNLKQVQFLLAQSRRIVAAGFDVPADLSVQWADRSGVTPLHTAVLKGNLAMVKLLLEAGADCLAQDSLGMSPLALAQCREGCGIFPAMQAHLSSLRAKSPKLRSPSQSNINFTENAAPLTSGVSNDVSGTLFGRPSIASSSPWSRSIDHRIGRTTGKSSTSSVQLLSALSVSSVQKKAAGAVAKKAVATATASSVGCASSPHSESSTSSSLNPIVEVPRDAILDFKLWMKQKQAATASITSLVSLSEVPETIIEDDEVCAVNRSVLRTSCTKRSSVLQRPVTPTVYGDVGRSASMTPAAASGAVSRSLAASVTPTSNVAWLQSLRPSSTIASGSHGQSKSARSLSGAMRRKNNSTSIRVAEELPLMPSSFLPRELDPVEALRAQEQRELAALQQRVMVSEQESRALTPAAFIRLKRRVLGASSCDDDTPAQPSGGDVLGMDPDITAAPSSFRPKLQANFRLRRLVF